MNTLIKEQMFKEIEDFFGADINTRTRKREVADLRHCWRVSMREMGYTTQAIGDMTGHDHSTVLNSEKAVSRLRQDNEGFNDLFNAMKSFLADFHVRHDIDKDQDYKELWNNLLTIYVDLLDYVSEGMEEKEKQEWIAAAGINNVHYHSILINLQN